MYTTGRALVEVPNVVGRIARARPGRAPYCVTKARMSRPIDDAVRPLYGSMCSATPIPAAPAALMIAGRPRSSKDPGPHQLTAIVPTRAATSSCMWVARTAES